MFEKHFFWPHLKLTKVPQTPLDLAPPPLLSVKMSKLELKMVPQKVTQNFWIRVGPPSLWGVY